MTSLNRSRLVVGVADMLRPLSWQLRVYSTSQIVMLGWGVPGPMTGGCSTGSCSSSAREWPGGMCPSGTGPGGRCIRGSAGGRPTARSRRCWPRCRRGRMRPGTSIGWSRWTPPSCAPTCADAVSPRRFPNAGTRSATGSGAAAGAVGRRLWRAVYSLFRRWQPVGVWARIVTGLQARADAIGSIRWEVSADSTVCRAHQHAAGARRQNLLAVWSASPLATSCLRHEQMPLAVRNLRGGSESHPSRDSLRSGSINVGVVQRVPRREYGCLRQGCSCQIRQRPSTRFRQ